MFDRRKRVATYALAAGLFWAVTVIATALPVDATEMADRRSGGESPSPSRSPAARPSPFAGMFPPPLLPSPIGSPRTQGRTILVPVIVYRSAPVMRTGAETYPGRSAPVSQPRENPRPAPPDFGEFEPRLISVSTGDSGRAVRDTVAVTIHRSGSSTQTVIVPRAAPAEP